MYKGNDLIGKSIITFDTGEIIDKVKNVFFDPRENRLLACVVDEGGIFAKTRVLPFSQIKAIGPDAITIENASAIVVADSHSEISKNLESPIMIKGTEVITEGGEMLGVIKDVFFDEKTGEIKGYDVSGGLLTDTYQGKSFLPADKIVKVGKDVVFVPEDVASLFEEQVGGIKAATQTASSKLKESTSAFPSEETKQRARKASETTQTNIQQGTEQLKQKASELWENVKSKTNELKGTATTKIEQNKIKDALGRPVSRVILNEHDEPILDVGDMITHSAIQKARDAGVLDILLNSVSKETMAYNPASKATSENNVGKQTPPDPTDTTIIVEKSE